MTDPSSGALARHVIALAAAQNCALTTAESCTGGLVMAALTDVAGASSVIEAGVIAYSNRIKQRSLFVPAETLRTHGAVSSECAAAMAKGALRFSRADLAISITGIAGPGGGSVEKPVGMVWFGLCAREQEPRSYLRQFGNVGRAEVRALSVQFALSLFAGALEGGDQLSPIA